MAKRTRATQGRRAYKKRRTSVRRRSRRSVNTLTTTRFVIRDTIAGSDVIPGNVKGYSFALSDVPASGEFTALFDQYRINKVQYRFVLRRDPDHATTTNNRGYLFRCMFVVDQDDATAPSNFAELQQYPRAREIWLNDNKPVSRWYSLTPTVVQAIYNGVANAYVPKSKQWVDVTYPSVPMYGLKMVYDQLYAGTDVFVEARYNMSFKNPR